MWSLAPGKGRQQLFGLTMREDAPPVRPLPPREDDDYGAGNFRILGPWSRVVSL